MMYSAHDDTLFSVFYNLQDYVWRTVPYDMTHAKIKRGV